MAALLLALGPGAEAYESLTPNDPNFAAQYALNNTGQAVGPPGNQVTGIADQDIDAPEGWRLRTDASNIIVAVLDFGVDYNHPDLSPNIWSNPGEIGGNGIDDDHNGYVDDVHGWDFASNDSDPSGSDHGTISAGVIGAAGNNGIGISGVAWKVKLMILRVNGTWAQTAIAVRYAVDNGARIINHTQVAPLAGTNAALASALSYANANGVLYVTPTSGQNVNHDTLFPCNSPEPVVICVTATNAQGSGGAGYGGASVDLAAPGNRIHSTVSTMSGSYSWSSGTSHAGPHVAGVAALILAQKPGIAADKVRETIMSTVDPLAGYAPNSSTPIVSGGRINLARALNSSLGAPQGFSTRIEGPNYADSQGWGSSPSHYETIQHGDVNGDGHDDVCARNNSNVECLLWSGGGFGIYVIGPAWSNANGWLAADKYKTIQLADINADGKDDLCGRSSLGFECWLSNGNGFPTQVNGPALSDALGWNASPAYYETIRMADVSGDGKADVCARGPTGIECFLSSGAGFPTQILGPAWSDANGWAAADKYKTIQLADINGDGKSDLCGRAADRFECWLSTGLGFPSKINGPVYSDAQGWSSSPSYYETIKMADVNGDGNADVCARGNSGTQCLLWTGGGFGLYILGPVWSNANGWSAPDKYKTMRLADVNGDGKADFCGRSAQGAECWLSNGLAFPTPLSGPSWHDSSAWTNPIYYSTIDHADVDGDDKQDLCARTATRYECWLAD